MNNTNMIIVALVIVVLLLVAYIAIRPGSGTPQQYTVSSQPTTVQSTTNPTTISSTQTSTPTTTVNSTPSYTVKLANNARVGKYLVNSTGYALYLYSLDTPNSGSTGCYNQCAVYWHPFYTANLTIPSNLSVSKFGMIVRTGGEKQLTYEGYPLYQYTGDNASGLINGNGVAGIWFAVTYPNLTS